MAFFSFRREGGSSMPSCPTGMSRSRLPQGKSMPYSTLRNAFSHRTDHDLHRRVALLHNHPAAIYNHKSQSSRSRSAGFCAFTLQFAESVIVASAISKLKSFPCFSSDSNSLPSRTSMRTRPCADMQTDIDANIYKDFTRSLPQTCSPANIGTTSVLITAKPANSLADPC